MEKRYCHNRRRCQQCPRPLPPAIFHQSESGLRPCRPSIPTTQLAAPPFPLPSFSQPTTVPAATAHTAPPQQPFPQSQPQVTEGSERFQSLPTQSASEKIRAVIYPGQQSWSRNIPERQDTGSADSGQKGQTSTMESGLAQLSRMIEEQKVSAQNTMRDGSPVPTAPPPVPGEETIAPWQQMGRPADPVAPAAPSPAGSLPLRAAPNLRARERQE